MIIHDLDVVRVSLVPDKADAPPVVDAEAVLPGMIALQSLEPIARRRSEIAQLRCAVQLAQYAPGDSFDGAKALAAQALMKALGLLAAKRLDHRKSV